MSQSCCKIVQIIGLCSEPLCIVAKIETEGMIALITRRILKTFWRLSANFLTVSFVRRDTLPGKHWHFFCLLPWLFYRTFGIFWSRHRRSSASSKQSSTSSDRYMCRKSLNRSGMYSKWKSPTLICRRRPNRSGNELLRDCYGDWRKGVRNTNALSSLLTSNS